MALTDGATATGATPPPVPLQVVAQHAGNSYRQAPEHIRRMLNQLLFEKLLVTIDEEGQHHVDASYAAPFDILFGADARDLVSEARRTQAAATPGNTGQVKKPTKIGGLFVDVLSDQFSALVEGSSKSIMVGLFSCHANLLRLVHEHLVTTPGSAVGAEVPATSARGVRVQLSPEQVQRVVQGYRAGKTVYELAAELRCHRTTISKTLKQQGITLRRVKPSESQINVMVHLYSNGLSLATIGQQLGFDGMTVRKYLLERGVRMRDAHARTR